MSYTFLRVSNRFGLHFYIRVHRLEGYLKLLLFFPKIATILKLTSEKIP